MQWFVSEAWAHVRVEDAHGWWMVWTASTLAALGCLAAHVTLGRGSRPARPFILASACVLSAGAIGAAAVQVMRARAETLELALGAVESAQPDVRSELIWLAITGLLTAVLAPSAGSALARSARRGPERRVVYGLTLAITLVGVAAMAYANGFLEALVSGYRSLGSRAEQRAGALANVGDLDPWLAGASWLVIVVGLLTAGLALRARSSAGMQRYPDRWMRVVAAGVFGVGLLLFLATRPHAHDRRRPVRFADPLFGPHESAIPLEGLPTACDPQATGPWLTVAGAARLDGRPTDPASAALHLATVRRNWAVLHPNSPFSGELRLSAAPNVRLSALMPYLEPARASGYRTLVIQAFRPVLIDTRTLGVISGRRRCPVRVELVEGAARAPSTVEALVREVVAGRTTVAVGR